MSQKIIEDFFVEASGAVDQIAQNIDRLAGRFRRHEIKQGNDGLALLANDLGQFVIMVDVLRGPLAIDPDLLIVGGVPLDDQISRLEGWLESLIEAQRNEDWLTVADILELDLEPMFRAWGPKLLECTSPLTSNGRHLDAP